MEDGAIVCEGPHILAEALASPWKVEQIFYSAHGVERHPALLSQTEKLGIEMTEVGERAFKAICDTENNQGLLALLTPRKYTWNDLTTSAGPLVVLDAIQDPGNAGSILRSTEAFGGAGLVFTEGCVRISNGKLLRAAAGSLFRLPVIENCQAKEIIQCMAQSGRTVFSLTAHSPRSLTSTSLKDPFALIIGSEGQGVSDFFLQASEPLSIPTDGVESLNASIACAIALFEARRQSL